MGKVYDGIDDRLRTWLLAQPMFVVATAPSGDGGHINASPKGMGGTFAVLSDTRVGYLDYTGSGAETIAHLRENGRVTLMFSAFTGPPKIVRLYGRGRPVFPGDAQFADLRGCFAKSRDLGLRSIIVVDLDRVADSCGYAVPRMDFVADRDVLDRGQERRDEAYFRKYWRTTNAESIDGQPAMPAETAALEATPG